MSLEVSVYLCRKIETQEKKMSDDRSLASLSVSFSTHINIDLTAFPLLRHHGNTVQSQERIGNQRTADAMTEQF